MRADGLGWLKWEYDRMRKLTMLRSAPFYYNARASGSLREITRGATSSQFCFQAVYGTQFGGNHTIGVDGPTAKRVCITRFIRPLKQIHEAFTRGGGMSVSIPFSPADMADTSTTTTSQVQAVYMAEVLLSWFERVRSVLNMRVAKQSDGDSLMTPIQFAPESERALDTYNWVLIKSQNFALHTCPGGIK